MTFTSVVNTTLVFNHMHNI